MLRLSFTTGTEPGKWFERYRRFTAHGGLETTSSDDALGMLLAGDADAALVRVPQGGIDKRICEADTHIVRLYTEAVGIAVPKDSVWAELGGAVHPADIDGERLNYCIAPDGSVAIDEVRAGLQLVAANVGVVIAPRPLLKVLSKKKVVPLELTDSAVARTEIVLVWLKKNDCDAIQDFVGIVKGRTLNSSRHESPKQKVRGKGKAGERTVSKGKNRRSRRR